MHRTPTISRDDRIFDPVTDPHVSSMPSADRQLLDRLWMSELEAPIGAQVFNSLDADALYGFELSSPDEPITYAVLAPDWAGLLDSCLGVVHAEGINVSSCLSWTLRRPDCTWGWLVFRTYVLSETGYRRSMERATRVTARMMRATKQDPIKQVLLRGEARRLDTYSKTADLLREMCEGSEESEIFSTSGEVAMFFLARTETYIHDRYPEDLAHEIVTNHRLQKRVQSDGGLHVWTGNITTRNGPRTAIQVASRPGLATLTDYIGLITRVTPGFRLTFNKSFITRTQVEMLRLELTGSEGEALPEDVLHDLEWALRGIIHRASENAPTPGVEIVQRKIVPVMLDEERELGIPQAYFHPQTQSHLKFVLVTSDADRGHALDVMETLNRLPGVSCAFPDIPSTMDAMRNGAPIQQEVAIGDVYLDMGTLFPQGVIGESFSDEILSKLEKAMADVPTLGGRIRVFDRGTRMVRKMRLDRLRAAISKEIPTTGPVVEEEWVRKLFYRLGDKYVLDMTVPDEELIQQIYAASATWNDSTPGGPICTRRSDWMRPDGTWGVAMAIVGSAGWDRNIPWAELLPGPPMGAWCRWDEGTRSLILLRWISHDGPVPEALMGRVQAAVLGNMRDDD